LVYVQRCVTVENRKPYNHEEVSAVAGSSVGSLTAGNVIYLILVSVRTNQ